MTKIFRQCKCGLILALIIFYTPVCQISEVTATTSKFPLLYDPPLRIIDSIPQPDAGIRNSTRVHDDTSFAVLIEARHGIDWSDPNAIRFLITDGEFAPYGRNLTSPAVRVVSAKSDSNKSELIWAVYDRSLESDLPLFYPLDAILQIYVDVMDLSGQTITGASFAFKIESDREQALGYDRLPESEPISVEASTDIYDAGIEIVSGNLTGARIFYDSREPLIPAFGPTGEVESVNGLSEQAVGAPLNLIPHTVFNHPVKLYIPFAAGTDPSEMDIYYHNGVEWLPACDTDGNILAGGMGWVVPGSRVDYGAHDPPAVEIEVYHFSSAQAVITGSSTTTDNIDRERHGSGATVVVSCFIDAARSEGLSLNGLLGLLGLLGWAARGLKFGGER